MSRDFEKIFSTNYLHARLSSDTMVAMPSQRFSPILHVPGPSQVITMTPMTVKKRQPRKTGGIEHHAADVLGRLQSGLRGLIAALPGVTRRPADLARTLDVPVKLAWQMHRLAQARDPLAHAGNLPGKAAMQGFLEASERRGAPRESVAAVRDALGEFDALIDAHAGSRSEFDSIITNLSEEGSQQVDLRHKRAAFKAQSHFLGVQAKTHLSCFVYHPSADDPDRIDGLGIRGMIDLRRLRQNASWIISQTRFTDDDGVVRQPVTRQPLDEEVEAKHGVSLLSQFCSQPLPAMRRVPGGMGLTNIEVMGEGVGNASAITCLVGDIYRGASVLYREEHNESQSSASRVRTPCEVLVTDVLVYEGLFGKARPKLAVYSDHRDNVVPTVVSGTRECDRLPVKDSVIYLGRGVDVMATADVPRYPEMMRWALKRAGWDPDKFDVYRCRIEFPMMPSSVVVSFDSPEKPADAD